MSRPSLLALSLCLLGCGRSAAPDDTSGCPVWYVDADGDGFGDPDRPVVQCDQPSGHVGNPYDCDDTNPDIHPLAIEVCDADEVDEDCDGLANDEDDWASGKRVDAWADADGDGHATSQVTLRCALGPGWHDAPGRDCDDDDPSIHPGAHDPVDGIDQNCDGFDGPALVDDFDIGEPNDSVWHEWGPSVLMTRFFVEQGSHAVKIGGGSTMVSTAIDTTVCESIAWHWLGMTQPSQPFPELLFEYHDGSDWVVLDRWDHDSEGVWEHRWGVLTATAALHPGFRIRLRASGPAHATIHVDQVQVGCSVESDGDDVPDGIDCAPHDPAHWFDCERCVDDDGDGRGVGCDLGPDCDDNDASVHPGAEDPPGDDIDSDCTGLDGPDFFDDFERGPGATVWSFHRDAQVEEGEARSGDHALHLGPHGAAWTLPLDLSSCSDGVWWEFQALQTEAGGHDLVRWSYEESDGSWTDVHIWHSLQSPLEAWTRRSGVLLADGVLRDDVRFRFSNSTQWGAWAIDDISILCLADEDGDLVPDHRDCEPADPAHWSDCGTCVDADGDSYGAGCDLGPDCDDGDPSVGPHAADALVDGIDQDCDGIDGPPILHETFDITPDPSKWFLSWSVWMSEPVEGSGTPGLQFLGWGDAEAAPIDASHCPALAWSYRGLGVRAWPYGSANLYFEYWTGADWVAAHTWELHPALPAEWLTHTGRTELAGVAASQLRIRLRGELPSSIDRFYVDDLAVGCAP